MRIFMPLFAALTMLIMMPQTGEAQVCDEDCVAIAGPNGSIRGFGCVSGGTEIRNCEATTTKCTGITCEQQTFLSYGSGVIVASVDLCPVAPRHILEVVAANAGKRAKLKSRLVVAAGERTPTLARDGASETAAVHLDSRS